MDSEWHPWIGSVAGAMLVGLSGIVPLLVFPDPSKLKSPSTTTPLGKYSNNLHLLQNLGIQYFHPKLIWITITEEEGYNNSNFSFGNQRLKRIFQFPLFCRWSGGIIEYNKWQCGPFIVEIIFSNKARFCSFIRDWSTAPAQWDNIDGLHTHIMKVFLTNFDHLAAENEKFLFAVRASVKLPTDFCLFISLNLEFTWFILLFFPDRTKPKF